MQSILFLFPREMILISNINILLLSLIILFSPLIEGGTTYFPVTIIRVITLVLLFCFLYSSFEKGCLRLRRANFDFLIFLFFLISGLSIFLSSYKNISIQWGINILNYILIFYLTLNIVRGKDDERVISGALITIVTFQSIYGICQYLILGFERARGTFFNPNFYASYISAITLVILGLLICREKERNSFFGRLGKLFFSPFFLSAISILAFTAIFLSKSRGASLSFLVGLFLMVTLFYKFNKKIILAIVLVILLILLIPNHLKTRIVNLPSRDIYAFSRINIWRSSLSIISDHPLGIGLGMYKYYFPKYNFPVEKALAFYGKKADTAHCEYLQICAELGIIGLLVFLSGIFFFYRKGLKVIKDAETPDEKGLNIGLIGGITVFFFQAAVDSTFHEPAIVILVMVSSGLLMRGSNIFFKEIKFVHKRKLSFLSFIVSLTILGIIFVNRFYLGYYFFIRGKDSLKSRNYIEAEESFKKAIFFNPSDASYYDSKANLLYNKYLESSNPEFLKGACDQLYFAISLNPKNAFLFEHLGFIYSTLSSVEKGGTRYLGIFLRCYSTAKGLDPFNAYYRNSIGEIYLNSAQLEKAEREFKILLAMEPNFLPARVNLLRIYEKFNKNNLAREEVENILNIYKRYKNFPFSGAYEKNFLKINMEEVRVKAKEFKIN